MQLKPEVLLPITGQVMQIDGKHVQGILFEVLPGMGVLLLKLASSAGMQSSLKYPLITSLNIAVQAFPAQ